MQLCDVERLNPEIVIRVTFKVITWFVLIVFWGVFCSNFKAYEEKNCQIWSKCIFMLFNGQFTAKPRRYFILGVLEGSQAPN